MDTSKLSSCLSLLLAGALTWPQGAMGQAFTADYGLSPARAPHAAPAPETRPGMLNLGRVRVNPVLQADSGFVGAGLSVEAGRNWFAQVGLGRGLQPYPSLPGSAVSADLVNIGGGYRWNDGRSLSLALNRSRSAERLGLAVSYDWPRYFVRLSYDTSFSPVPKDSLRFSAGVRF